MILKILLVSKTRRKYKNDERITWLMAVFTGMQGGPLEHVIAAAKQFAFGEILDDSF